MERRKFNSVVLGGLGLLSAVSVVGKANAQTSGTTAAKQIEYLYWLSDNERKNARDFAMLILGELDATPFDNRRVSGIYQRGSSALQKRTSETAFVSRVSKYRSNLGSPRERAFQSVEGGFKFLPNNPDGRYAIVIFDTLFAGSDTIYTEQVTVAQVSSTGLAWQFVDYYLSTKPFYTY